MIRDADIFDDVLVYVTNYSTTIDMGVYKGNQAEGMATDFNTPYCFESNILLCDRLCAWANDSYRDVRISLRE